MVDVFQTGIGNYTTFGAQLELFAIAAVIIGGASLIGGKGRIMASAVGVLLLKVLENGLNLSGVEPFWRFIAVGHHPRRGHRDRPALPGPVLSRSR